MPTPSSGPPEPNTQDLSAAIDTLARMTSSAEFLSVIEEIQSASDSERLDTARRLATVNELRSRGLPEAEGLRFTTRYFEKRPDAPHVDEQIIDTTEAAADSGTWTLCASLGYIACVTIGHNFLTVDEVDLPPS